MSARNWDSEFWAIIHSNLGKGQQGEVRAEQPRVEQDGGTRYHGRVVEFPAHQLHCENVDPAKYCPTPDRCRAMDEAGGLPVFCSLCDQIATEMMRRTYDSAKYDYLDPDPDPGD